MNKENFLNSKQGKIIIGSSSAVALVILTVVLLWTFEMWPFSKTLDLEKLKTLEANFKVVTISDEELKDQSKVKSVVKNVKENFDNVYNTIENLVKKQSELIKEDTKSKMENMKTIIEEIKNNSETSPFDAAAQTAFKNSYNKLKDADIKALFASIKSNLKL
ncbi:hypothetical protein FEF22_000875 [Texas Phoenix palm phytoplasma]|uniref:Immunodominant membrane protein n=1 Tax=Texas Phoenix palm phytoplasma TaxID=176709 RepID=A0ABS5BID8_9MOLU|nr:hypothetical protein [Texas Phoenix palm phytoplasma]MBP3059341.1 hypothetical protein [Texas Phoenix palm phytoplasma]